MKEMGKYMIYCEEDGLGWLHSIDADTLKEAKVQAKEFMRENIKDDVGFDTEAWIYKRVSKVFNDDEVL
jgi:hypothetical protein